MRLFIILFVLLVTVSVPAQKQVQGGDWEATPIDEWSADQVNYILTRSPWVKLITADTAISNPLLGPGGLMFKSDTLVVLRSSALIKYALFRQRQLIEKYASMSADAKSAFNAKNKIVLECPACEKYYVVSITGASATLRDKNMVMSRSKLIFLSNDKGEKRFLANFSPQGDPGTEAMFFFPRNDEKGQPLISSTNEKVIFNFKVESPEDPRVRTFEKVEFKVNDLVRDGKVIF
jgi:hypothetical protein